MLRKASVTLALLLVVLAAFLLTACETTSTPQPTATAKPQTPEPIQTRSGTPESPDMGEEYPTIPRDYP
jgi:uncharacterized lipoprotein YajG